MGDKQLSRISCDIWPQSTIESLQSELRKRADEEIAKRESEFKEMLDQMERDYSQKEQVCTPRARVSTFLPSWKIFSYVFHLASSKSS